MSQHITRDSAVSHDEANYHVHCCVGPSQSQISDANVNPSLVIDRSMEDDARRHALRFKTECNESIPKHTRLARR